MTRLIDADAIKNLEWIIERGTADCGEEFVYMSAINEMPTVEAIPIEWLKEWAKKEDNFFGGTLYVSLISTILTDWQLRKEE